MATTNDIYWDSCAFIHRFQETQEFLPALQMAIDRAKNGEFRIVTSTVTLAEVCRIPDQGMLPIEQTTQILDFFRNDYVALFQADRWVCEEAHHLIRHHALMPMDAIHVATALMAQVRLVVTTDGKKHRRAGLLRHNMKIGNPPLRIESPDLGVFLPLFGKPAKPAQ